jgi:hypothetical protein
MDFRPHPFALEKLVNMHKGLCMGMTIDRACEDF